MLKKKSEALVDEDTGEVFIPKKVTSWLNYQYVKSNKPKGIDQTIPDQSMSLREIVVKHSRGMEINGVKTAIFDEAEIAAGINPWTLDLIDLQELKIINEEEIISLRNRAITEKAERAKKADEARAVLQDEAAQKAFQLWQQKYGNIKTDER